MTISSKVLATQPAENNAANRFFAHKLACETDCSDVYSDIKTGVNNFVLVDVRSTEAFNKSHAITAVSMPNDTITEETLAQYSKDTVFVVYCWGPGCNGATKAGKLISALGFAVKEMIGGIHYWEDFERYPVNRLTTAVQV